MVRIATVVAMLLLAGCSADAFNQSAHVPSYRHPFVSEPSNAGYEPPNSLPR